MLRTYFLNILVRCQFLKNFGLLKTFLIGLASLFYNKKLKLIRSLQLNSICTLNEICLTGVFTDLKDHACIRFTILFQNSVREPFKKKIFFSVKKEVKQYSFITLTLCSIQISITVWNIRSDQNFIVHFLRNY